MTREALAFLVCCALVLLAACGGGGTPVPSPTPSPPASATLDTSRPGGAAAPAAPVSDLYDLAVRFGLAPASTPRTLSPGPQPEVGSSRQFFVIDNTSGLMGSTQAQLRLVTDNAYFYVADGTSVPDTNLRRAAQDFEGSVYPQVTAAFGQEWRPGIDGDPHIIIFIGRLDGVGGYVTDNDEYTRAIYAYSNEGEIIYMDAGEDPGSANFKATLAHELQHVIHGHVDVSEEIWVNEGLSQLAAELLGGGLAPIFAFLASPDVQLTDWVSLTDEHYGASELFMRYLFGRFGGTAAAKELVAEQADDIAGIDAFLKPRGSSFREVFTDWIVANYLDASSGPYSHAGATLRVRNVSRVDTYRQGTDSVSQFGADYFHLTPPAPGGIFQIEGDKTTLLVKAGDGSNPYWFSGRGDNIDSRLTRQVDLSAVSKATLNFRTWFDSEEHWDYAYVAVSADDGHTWQALPGRNTTTFDPLRVTYGPGYTGISGPGKEAGWVDETVDLAPFAGKKVLLRFEYVTDEATNISGFAVDDIAIPEIGLRDDASSDSGWQAEGFVRVTAPLQQQFIVEVIENDDPGQVRRVELDADNRAGIRINGPATIVIAGATEITREKAGYRWSFTAPAV